MKVRKAVIAAAGWGTRFLPVTKTQPKEMLPLLNKPLIQYSVEEAVAAGAELVVIITASGKRSIEDYFDRHYELESMLEQKGETRIVQEMRRVCSMADICYVRQKEQLGLGHAVLMARSIIGNEPFMLLLPDDLFEQQDAVLRGMIEVSNRFDASTVAVTRVSQSDVSRYGIVNPRRISDRVYEVSDMVEKPPLDKAPSDLAVMGRYVLTPDVFEVLESTLPGRNKEIQLTDGLRQMAQKRPIYGYEFDGERYDAGTPMGWLKTTMALAMKDPAYGPELRNYIAGLDAKAAIPSLFIAKPADKFAQKINR